MRLRRLVHRAHNPKWAFRPDSGEGAALYGGRFNRIGVSALYTSLRPETAWLEAQQAFAFKAQPMTMCAYRVDCEDIVDLTDPGVLDVLEIAAADLACAWEDLVDKKVTPPSWTIVDRLIDQGSAGILAPSFAAGASAIDVNAVFWRWTESTPHRVIVVDGESRLPKDSSSWR